MARPTGLTAGFSTYFCYEGTITELNDLMHLACKAGLEPIDGARFSRITPPPASTPLYLQTFVGYAPQWDNQPDVVAFFTP